MPDVKVGITGDASDLEKAVKKAEKALKGLGTSAEETQKKLERIAKARAKADEIFAASGVNESIERARASIKRLQDANGGAEQSTSRLSSAMAGLAKAGRASLGAVAGLGGLLTGGLGAVVASTAIGKVSEALDQLFSRGIRQAQEARAVFESAFESLVKFNIHGGAGFAVDTRQQLVDLGRVAKVEVDRVKKELERLGTESGLTKLGGPAGILGSTLDALNDKTRRLIGSVSDEVEQGNRVRDSLLEQQATAQATLDIYSNRLKLLDQTVKLEKELETSGLRSLARKSPIADVQKVGAAGLGEHRFNKTILNPSKDLDLAKILPDSFAVKLANLQNAINAGVVPALDGMRQQAVLLQQELLVMLQQGVDPASSSFAFLLEQLNATREGLAAQGPEIKKNAVTFKILQGVATEALSGIAFKFEEATSAAAKFRNTLRGIGNRLLDIGLSAGINFGLGALTGNPLTFVDSLKGVLGVTSASGPGPRGGLSSASPSSASSGPQPIPLQVQALRVSGGDLLLTLQEAQGTRGVGGVSLS